jgi:hypothetical protein
MTDLQNIIIMLTKSDEEFEKKKTGKDWKVTVTGRDIEFYFNEDGSFRFLCKA